MADPKQVLVRVGVSNRVVSLSSDEDLFPEIRRVFSDLPELASDSKLIVQIKDEEWGGAFVDLSDGQKIPHKSVLNVAILAQAQQVSFYTYIYIVNSVTGRCL